MRWIKRATVGLCFMVGILGFGSRPPRVGAAEPPEFPQYVGVLRHDDIGRDQRVKLDFVPLKEIDGIVHLIAILKLYFGDFASREYVSYFFPESTYKLATKELYLGHADQILMVAVKSFENGTFLGEARSELAGKIGTLTLSAEGSAVHLENPLGSVAGEYRGHCSNKQAIMQLQTFRSVADSVRMGNPFGGYEIRGSLAMDDPDLCAYNKRGFCIVNQIYAGTYNYFINSLVLFGKEHPMNCRLASEDLIECSDCRLVRQKERPQPRRESQSMPENALLKRGRPSAPPEGEEEEAYTFEAIAGDYTGYLHHEYLDQYQAASLHVVVQRTPPDDADDLKVSAIANLYFGSHESNEMLSYRFEDEKQGHAVREFTLESVHKDVDALLHITQVGPSTVSGVWYSILFGRVGTFVMGRGGIGPLPPDLQTFRRVKGQYRSETMSLDLGVRLSNSPFNTENPFFPLTFGGYFYFSHDIAGRFQITNGSYDFYTGLIGFQIEEGARAVSGGIDPSGGRLNLLWTARGFARQQQPYVFQEFDVTAQSQHKIESLLGGRKR